MKKRRRFVYCLILILSFAMLLQFPLQSSVYASDTDDSTAAVDATTDSTSNETGSDEEETTGETTADTTTETSEGDLQILKVAPVKMNGIEYDSIQDAVNAAGSQAMTITICTDIELTETVRIPADSSITITDDGTSHAISSADGANVHPLFQVAKGGTLTLDGTGDDHLILNGTSVSNRSSTASTILNMGSLMFKHGTINGGTLSNSSMSAAIISENDSQFTMSGGIIQDTNADTSWYGTTVLVRDNATFDMSGGTIRNNSATYSSSLSGGGAVLLFCWNSGKVKMTMSGGTITGNKSYNGGGIYMTGGTSLHMTGGTISDNSASGQGGGVCVAAVSAKFDPDTAFIMDGGKISGNKARNGGGIYVNSDGVYLNAGYIENNVASARSYYQGSGHGGGIYVSETPRVLHVSNALITENKAVALNTFGGTSGMGGGLWACPTGSIDLKVTNGVAIYGNSASGTGTAGDDVVKVNYSNSTAKGTVTLADRMLGGGQVKWYQDGGIKGGSVGSVDSSVSRYDAANPGEEVHFSNTSSNIAAKAVVSENAIKAAESQAKLFIRNNTASHGGGIGTNGDVALKEPSINDSPSDEWTLKVTKVWDGVAEADQKPVTISLKVGDLSLDSVTLSEDNEWTAEFTELPDPSSMEKQQISVEEQTGGYQVSYSTRTDSDNHLISVIVTNQPARENILLDEDNPLDSDRSAYTGDDSILLPVLMAIMALALLSMIVAVVIGRKKV